MEVLTPHQIESSISELCYALEAETEHYAEISVSSAVAEADYKLAYATHMVAASFVVTEKRITADARGAGVDLLCAHEFQDWKVKEARRQATKESLLSIRARLDAMRTLSATLRSQT